MQRITTLRQERVSIKATISKESDDLPDLDALLQRLNLNEPPSKDTESSKPAKIHSENKVARREEDSRDPYEPNRQQAFTPSGRSVRIRRHRLIIESDSEDENENDENTTELDAQPKLSLTERLLNEKPQGKDTDDSPESTDGAGFLVFDDGLSKNVFSLSPTEKSSNSPKASPSTPSTDDDSDDPFTVPDKSPVARTPRTPFRDIQSKLLVTPSKTPAAKRAFRNKREQMARDFFRELNEEVFSDKLPEDLEIGWSAGLNTTAGRAFLKREYKRDSWKHSARIELSSKVVDDEAKLRTTLAHELCHVAAWIVNGVSKPPHGPVFKYWATRVMTAYPNLEINTCHNYDIDYKYRWECVSCGKIYGRHSKSIDTSMHGCGVCHGKLRFMERLKKDGTPYKARQPNAFQQYMKDHLRRIKQENPGKTHAEVMRLLSEEYRTSSANNPRSRAAMTPNPSRKGSALAAGMTPFADRIVTGRLEREGGEHAEDSLVRAVGELKI
ncbi:uncharacterized protein VTP21DRAFT_10089 [Calcarisporiella thermophila]|uniref:uncharacterized protein n=1 Tax=Calcarisporiella thermophila TaxID=911321 RepID=UPI003742B25E